MQQKNLKGLSLRELEEFALSLGEKPYRGRQLFDWIYNKQVSDFGAMTSMSVGLRERLRAGANIDAIRLVDEKGSRSDGTVKYLFGLADGKKIETVLIPPKTAYRSSGIFPGQDQADTDGDDPPSDGTGQKRHTLLFSIQVG